MGPGETMMITRFGLSLAFAVAVAAPATALAQTLEFGGNDARAKAVVEADMAGAIREAKAAGADVSVFTARADLNGDGALEILGQVSSGYLCVRDGCPLLIFVAEAGRFRKVGDDLGAFVDVLPTRTRGWRDLKITRQFGESRLTWDGKAYR